MPLLQKSAGTIDDTFLCDDPTVATTRNTEFRAILNWLSKVDTDPVLKELITAFWYNNSYKLDIDVPYVYQEVYTALREIGVVYMWMGLLPVHLVDLQE